MRTHPNGLFSFVDHVQSSSNKLASVLNNSESISIRFSTHSCASFVVTLSVVEDPEQKASLAKDVTCSQNRGNSCGRCIAANPRRLIEDNLNSKFARTLNIAQVDLRFVQTNRNWKVIRVSDILLTRESSRCVM